LICESTGGSVKAEGLGDGGWGAIAKLRLTLPPDIVTSPINLQIEVLR